MHHAFVVGIVIAVSALEARAQTEKPDTSVGDKMIAEYFRVETNKLSQPLSDRFKTKDEWVAAKQQLREQLLDMLGLNPLPERTPLNVTITGTVERDDFKVQKLHFQSSPGLYVTANLYLPKQAKGKLPAVLYVCGHGMVKKNGISYGNKTHYHHHGSWFARNGFVCLTIDTLQLGEIEGIHHGTYRENMWWWLNRGYTPAGVEAWNCMRAIDYLQTRPEVDGECIGVTGRSGGGAYSWWVASTDERIKCAIPVAGVTDLRNHIYDGQTNRFPDGCVEGHCDCMFMVNTYRWDYPQLAAMVAPRPLMISNSDNDTIFPLDGVYRTYSQARHIYSLLNATDKVSLNITQGGHSDTQQLRVSAFDWLNRHLKGKSEPITKLADKFFEPEELKVFETLPEDQINTAIHETFVPAADAPSPPTSLDEWNTKRDALMKSLEERTFAGWPETPEPLAAEDAFRETKDVLTLRAIDFTSQNAIRLRLYVLQKATDEAPKLIVLNPVNEEGWQSFLTTVAPAFSEHVPNPEKPGDSDYKSVQHMIRNFNWAMAWVGPRGIGLTRWNQTEKKQTQHRRRFYLLGQTLDGMRVYDIKRALEVLESDKELKSVPRWLQADGTMSGLAVYASLFAKPLARMDLHNPPKSHRDGPFLLNVRRFMNMPEAMAMAAEKHRIVVYQDDEGGWSYPTTVTRMMKKPKHFSIRVAE